MTTAGRAPVDAQGPITIPDAPGLWQLTTARYDYATAPTQCPICGGVGLPWRGWFHCDSKCHAIAVVADGRTFLPVRLARHSSRSDSGTPQRCPSRGLSDVQCGNYAGHLGAHTVLIPTGAPWFPHAPEPR